MSTVADVLAALERLAPSRVSMPGDRLGLQVGDPSSPVRRAVVSLDASHGAIAHAAGRAEMLVCHHPVVWEPLAGLSGTYSGERCAALAREGLAFAAAHTNWDCARGGVNDALAARLGLADVRPFGMAAVDPGRLKLVCHVPEASLEAVLDAVSIAGAGEIGAYRRCAYWSLGTGTFEPMPGASPAVGEVGRRETVQEARLEAVLPATARAAVEAALLAAHPYEEPAFEFYASQGRSAHYGRLGRLPRPMGPQELGEYAAERLGGPVAVYGTAESGLLGVVGGAAAGEWGSAAREGAAFLTGEVPHHVGLEAADRGTTVVAAGHYATEQPGAEALAEALARELPGIEFEAYAPPPGHGGRPW